MPDITINNETLTYNNIIYVDSISGDDTNGDGSKELPYKTLNTAMNNVTANNNEAIKLADGFYTVNTIHNIFDLKDVDFVGNEYETKIEVYKSRNQYSSYNNGDIKKNFYNIVFTVHDNYKSNSDDSTYTYFYNLSTHTPTDAVYNFGAYNCVFNAKDQFKTLGFFLLDGTSSDFTVNKFEIKNCLFISSNNTPPVHVDANNSNDYKIINTATNSDSIYNTDRNTPYLSTNLTEVSYDSNYNITSSGWQDAGTGTDPDGSTADIGIYGGTYAWGDWIKIYHLLKDGTDIKTYDNSWTTICQSGDEAESDFLNDGIESLSNIPLEDLHVLNSNAEILTYVSDSNKSNINLNINGTVNYINALESNNPEILAWRSSKEKTDKNVKLNALPNSKVIQANDDVYIGNIRNIDNINLKATVPTKSTLLSETLGQIDGDTRVTRSLDCSNLDYSLRVKCDLYSDSMDNSNESVHLLWYTGTEWKIIAEAYNETKTVDTIIPDSWLSSDSKIQLDIIGGGDIHTDGNGSGDYAKATDLKVIEENQSFIKVATSIDKGYSWYSYQDGSWQIVNIEDKEQFKSNGMTPSEIASCTDWDNLVGDNDYIRFAYYIEQPTVNDVVSVDQLEMQADLNGQWKGAYYGTDYDYEYSYKNKVLVDIKQDGSYKINYTK